MPMSFNPSDVSREYRTVEDFMNELAQRLGKHYGLKDIREAL